jgi:cobyrinic acid a,c-diamide synthase
MGRLPRIALGTLQTQVDTQPLAWGLLEALSRRGVQVQHFLSRACFTPWDAVPAITGLQSRHLDSWSMSPEVCRELFLRGAGECDLAVVEGTLADETIPTVDTTSRLETLCQWLSLPRIGILDVTRLGSCRLPPRPESLDALLLDQIADEGDFYRWQTCIESLWGVPVVGALEQLPRVRSAIAALPFGGAPEPALCQKLGESLARWTDVGQLLRIGRSAPGLESVPSDVPGCVSGPPVRVAVAYDAAFHCYFPDTLEMLELCGATVVNFSPLRDECLPPETDIVYFGCGHPERFANELAANCCIQTALRTHVCSGRRVYAEGGGLAYLCRYIQDLDGKCLPMAGVLPATARLNRERVSLDPLEATLAVGNWLAPAGASVRGYLNPYWIVEPCGELACYLDDSAHKHDLVGRHHAVGSRLHLNFAAQPAVFRSFLQPHAPSLKLAPSGSGR